MLFRSAPFLSEKQIAELYKSSKDIMKKAGYIGAGTCEFLIGNDGTISFLEVNTRLQVEHPVSEEVTGIDLVRSQFRIADGEKIDPVDPVIRGHSIEFRINGEDPGKGFLPSLGTITKWEVPDGPGVRIDAGFDHGHTIGSHFDSLLAKLIVTGATREQALERSRRALAEMHIEGMPTVLPFHRKIVSDPAFTGETGKFGVYTRWIETEWNNDIEPWSGIGSATEAEAERNNVVVEVGGKRIEVSLPKQLFLSGGGAKASQAPKRKAHSNVQIDSGKALVSQMQATVVKIAVKEGDKVPEGAQLLVLEAMKMESPQNAAKEVVIKKIHVAVGATIPAGTVLMEFEE